MTTADGARTPTTPVGVRMPVRIRLDLDPGHGQDEILAPLTDALDAAVTRAADRALAVRMVAGRPLTGDPVVDVAWSGDRLPSTLTAPLERSVREVLDRAARRFAGSAGDAGAAVARPQESLDEDRLDVLDDGADAYLVPFYDDDGNLVPLRLGDDRPTAAKKRGSRPPTRTVLRLRAFAEAAEVWAAVVQAYRGSPPPQVAAVYRSAADEQTMIAFFDCTAGEPRIVGMMTVFVWDIEGNVAHERRPGFASADEFATIGTAVGAAAQTDLRVRIALSILGRDAGAAGDPLVKQVRQLVGLYPPFPSEVMYAYRIASHGRTVWAGESATPAPLGRCPVAVLSESVVLDRPERVYGRNCGPLTGAGNQEWLAALGLLHPDPGTPEAAFLGEPDIALLPAGAYQLLESRVNEVAGLLHMSPLPYVGGFLIAAMAHIDKRCRGLMSSGAPPGYQLREMAQAFGPIRQLLDTYLSALSETDARQALPCPLAAHLPEWKLRFWQVYAPARDDAVASMFVSTCQNELLQVLIASGKELQRRYEKRGEYLPITRQLLTVMFSDTVQLMDLRRALHEREARDAAEQMAMADVGGMAWLAATHLVLRSAEEDPPGRTPEAGTVVPHAGGYRVYDGKGRWWTGPELDAVIAAQRQEAIGVDPLLDKVTEVDELVRRLQKAHELDARGATAQGWAMTSAVDEFFEKLLLDLRRQNAERAQEVVRDRTLAFGLASFTEDRSPDNEIGAKLSGIHQVADTTLRRSFTDLDAYDSGLSRLAQLEIGRAELWDFVNLVGPILLTVFCPPLAIVAAAWNIGLAVEGVETAMEHRDLQRAMLGGDAILTRAQVEAEMWVSTLSLVISVLPEVPTAAKAATSAGRAVVKGETREVAGAALREAMQRASAHLAELTIQRFALAFTEELTQAYLINWAFSHVMNHIAEVVAREATVGDASVADVLGALTRTPLIGDAP